MTVAVEDAPEVILDGEEWRDVPDWEGFYQVSDEGVVRSMDRRVSTPTGFRNIRGVTLRPNVRRSYLGVALCRDGIVKMESVHGIVAATFIGPRPTGSQVCHGNGVKDDNRLSNLRYGTPSENALDSILHGTNRESNKTHCVHGHEYTPANTRTHRKTDGRTCRACGTCRSIKNRRDRLAREYRNRQA